MFNVNQCQKKVAKMSVMSEPQRYFGVQLDTQCHKLELRQTTGTVKLTDLEEDIQVILLWRAGLLGHEGELIICFHHQQLFGNVFERRAKYRCWVLGSHQSRVQSKTKILLGSKRTQSKRLQCYSWTFPLSSVC